MTANYSKTYEVINFDRNLPVLAGENSTHFIYYCPNCEYKRDRHDRDGKFYWSKEKSVGYCHKCVTAFFPESNESVVHQELNNTITATISRLRNEERFIDPPRIQFDFDELTLENLAYLKSRHLFLPILAKYLHCKSWNGSKKGTVFPFFYKNYISGFQARFHTDDKSSRYYTSGGNHKILYSPVHVFTNFNLRPWDGTITLVEGIFDAIAALIMGYPSPLAVFGSSVSAYQILLLRKLLPDNAFIMMDNKDISWAIAKQIKKEVKSISDTQIIHFNGLDPEEHFKIQLEDKDKLSEYSNYLRTSLLR